MVAQELCASQALLPLFLLGFMTCNCERSSVYGTCSDHTECPSNARCRPSSCDGYICICDEGFVASQDRRRCMKAAGIGEPCFNLTSRCVSLFAACTEGTCRCLDIFMETNDGRCKLPGTSFVGESCGKCEYPAHCVDGVCRCVDNYRPLTHDEYWVDPLSTVQCRPQGYALNKCNGTEIPVPLPLLTLTRSTPVYSETEMSGKTQPAVFGSCTSHAECPKFAKCKPGSCDGFLCLCDSGFVASEHRTSCLRARRIGEACNSQTDRCMSPFSSCTNSFCACLDTFQPTADGRCKLSGNNFLGEPCVNSQQCEYPSKCVNESCVCVEPYRQITHEEFWMDPMVTSQCRPLGFSVWKCNETQLDIPAELSSRQTTSANSQDVISIDSSVRITTEGYRSFSQFHPSNLIPKFISALDAINLQVNSRSTTPSLTTQIPEKPLNFNHSVDVSESHHLISLTPSQVNMNERHRSSHSYQDAQEYTTSQSNQGQNSESQKNTSYANDMLSKHLTNPSSTPFNGNLTSHTQIKVNNNSFDQTRLIERLSRWGILRLFDDRVNIKSLIRSFANSNTNSSQDIVSYSSTLPPKSTADIMATKGDVTLNNRTDLQVDLGHTKINTRDKMTIPFLSQNSFLTGTLSQNTEILVQPAGKDLTNLMDGKRYEKKDNSFLSTTITSTQYRMHSFLNKTNDRFILEGHISNTTTYNPDTGTAVNPIAGTNLPLSFTTPTTQIYSPFSEVPKGFPEITSSTLTEAIEGNKIYSITDKTGNSFLSTSLSSSQDATTLSSLQTSLEIPQIVTTIPYGHMSGTNEDNDFVSDLTSQNTYNEEITTHLPDDFIDTTLVPVEITNEGGNLFLNNLGGFTRVLDGMLTFDGGYTAILFTAGLSEISQGRVLLHTVNNMSLEVVHSQGKTSVIKRQERAVTSFYGGTLSLMYYRSINDNQTEPMVTGRPSEKVKNQSSEIFWEILRSNLISKLTPGNKTKNSFSKAELLYKATRGGGKRNNNIVMKNDIVKFDSDRDQTLHSKNDLIPSTQTSTIMYSPSYRSLSATASLDQGRENMKDYLNKLMFSIMEYVASIRPILQLIDRDTNVKNISFDESLVYFINGKSHLNIDSGKVYVMQGGEQPVINIEVVGNVSVILKGGILLVQLSNSSLNFDVNGTNVHFRNSSLFITYNSSNFVVDVRRGSIDIALGNNTRTIHSNDQKLVLSHSQTKHVRMYSQHIIFKAELNGLVWTYHNVSHMTTYQKEWISSIENTNGKSDIRIGKLNNVLIFHNGSTDIVHRNGSGFMIKDMSELSLENKYGTVKAEMTENKQLILLDEGISQLLSIKYHLQVKQLNGTMCVWQEKSFVRQAIEIMNNNVETPIEDTAIEIMNNNEEIPIVEDATIPVSTTIHNLENNTEAISPDALTQFVSNRSDSGFDTYTEVITSHMSLIETRLSGIDGSNFMSDNDESTVVSIPTEMTFNLATQAATAKSRTELNQPTFHDSNSLTKRNEEPKEAAKDIEAREHMYGQLRATRADLNNTLFHESQNATAPKDFNGTLPFTTNILTETVAETSDATRNGNINSATNTGNYAAPSTDQSDVNDTIFTESIVATITHGESNGTLAREITLSTAQAIDTDSNNNSSNVTTLNGAMLYERNYSTETSTERLRLRDYTTSNISEHSAISTINYLEPNATQTEMHDVLSNKKMKLGVRFRQSTSTMRVTAFNTFETNSVNRNSNVISVSVSFKRNNLTATSGELYVKSSAMHSDKINSGTYTEARTNDIKDTALKEIITSTVTTSRNGTTRETTFSMRNFVEQTPIEPLSNSTVPYNESRSTLTIAETPSTSTKAYHSTSTKVYHSTSTTAYHSTSRMAYHSTSNKAYHSTSTKAYHITGKQNTIDVSYSKKDVTLARNLSKEIATSGRKPELILEKSNSDNSMLIPLNIAGILAAAALATLIALVLRSRKRRQAKDELNTLSSRSSSDNGEAGGSQVHIRIPRPSITYEPYYVKDGWQTISTSFSSKQNRVSPHAKAWQEQPDLSSDRISADFEA